MTILGIIGCGFFFGIGLALAYIIYLSILLILKQVYINYIMRKITKKPKQKKPTDLEFGELND